MTRSSLILGAAVALSVAACGVVQDFGPAPDGASDAGSTPDGDASTPLLPDAGPPAPPAWSSTVLSMDHPGGAFGSSMARTEARVVVGAPGEGTALGASVGAVYVFERHGDRWVRGQRLQAPIPAAYARFGGNVAVHDDLIAVSSTRDRDGVVHVFGIRDGFWTEVVAIPAPFPGSVGLISGLVLTGDTLAVGSAAGLSLYARVGESFRYVRTIRGDNIEVRGLVGSDQLIAVSRYRLGGGPLSYVILAKGGAWSDPVGLPEVTAQRSVVTLAADGTRVAVGEPCASAPYYGRGCGKVTVYELATGRPEPIAQIAEPADCFRFADALSLRGGRLATAGHVFSQALGWGEESLVVTGDAAGPDFDARGSTKHVSYAAALGVDDVLFPTNEAVVRVKLGEPDSKAQLRSLQKLTASEGSSNPGLKRFGDRVSVAGEVAVLEGTTSTESPVPYSATPFAVYGTSSAYLFERRSGEWRFKQALPGHGPCAVAPDAVACRSPEGGVDVFSRAADGRWALAQTLAGAEQVDAVAIQGDRLVVALGSPSGRVEIHERSGGRWSLVHRWSESGFRLPVLAMGPDLVAMLWHSADRTIAGGAVRGLPDRIRALVRTPAGWSDAGIVVTGDASDSKSMDVFVDVGVSGDRIVLLRSLYTNVVGPDPSDNVGTLEEFARRDSAWAPSGRLPLEVPRWSGVTSLARDGNDWIVGAPGDGTGAAILVTRTDKGFVAGSRWRDPGALGGAEFAYSAAAGGGVRIVGEPGHARVHVFERSHPSSVP